MSFPLCIDFWWGCGDESCYLPELGEKIEGAMMPCNCPVMAELAVSLRIHLRMAEMGKISQNLERMAEIVGVCQFLYEDG